MSDGEEYEVGRKNRKLHWQYQVRWKNYSPGDDTWEPPESFEGSEQFIDAFWERVSPQLDGRDVNNLKLFEYGQHFVPVGPPRGKKRRRSSVEVQHQLSISRPTTPPSPETGSSSFEVELGEPHTKRSRHEAPGSSNRKALPRRRKKFAAVDNETTEDPRVGSTPAPAPTLPSREPSEVVPETEFEDDTDGDAVPQAVVPLHLRQQAQPSTSAIDASLVDGDLFGDLEECISVSRVSDPPSAQHTGFSHHTATPSHRTRLSKPLVKILDDPNEERPKDTIAVKARLTEVAPINRPEQPHKGLNRKNRASLLTFSKGELKTIKGKYRQLEPEIVMSIDNGLAVTDGAIAVASLDLVPNAQEPPVAIPSPDPIPDVQDATVQETEIVPNDQPMVHTVEDGGNLPDYDDGDDFRDCNVALDGVENIAVEPDSGIPGLSSSSVPPLSAAETSYAAPSHSTTSLFQASANTIFSPLSLGAPTSSSPAPASPNSPGVHHQFTLAVDMSVQTPVLFIEVPGNTSAESPSFDSIVGGTQQYCGSQRYTPGKFYRDEAASTLLYTVRASGPSARVASAATGEAEKRIFDKFRARLWSGDMFFATSGVQSLVFCAVGSPHAMRLNLPHALRSIPGDIAVSRVLVEDSTAYADASANYVRW
ncbi:hypothetical protein FISHEDRAFT_62464 [Fistulina hepatica ATCC 64428]|nr:hypothetical protein FISHEDRAFT_62464 [Fistulina hepatica ATCC 64428]